MSSRPITLITAQSLIAELEAMGEHEQARTLSQDIAVYRQPLGDDPIRRPPIDRRTKYPGCFGER